MPSTPTTKSQVQAYRFVLRRMESALVRKDPVMLHEPMRAHSRATLAGVCLALVGLVGFLVVAALNPDPSVSTDKPGIVISQPSGAIYVVNPKLGQLIPVFNMASARLLLAAQSTNGQSASGGSAPTAVVPTVVSDSLLKNMPMGRLTGIPDGPQSLPAPGDAATDWAVCDQISPGRPPQTTVLAGVHNIGTTLGDDEGLLVSGPDGKTYLVYARPHDVNNPDDSQVRAEIDLSDSAVTLALHLQNMQTRKISGALLNAIPEVGKIANPVAPLPQYGQPGPAGLGLKVGQSFQVQNLGGAPTYYVVTSGTSVESVTPTVAQIVRYEDKSGQSLIPSIPPGDVPTNQDLSDPLHVTTYPDQIPQVIDASTKPVMCLGWSADFTDPTKPLAKTRVTVDVQSEVPGDGNGGTKATQIGQPSPDGQMINWFFMNQGQGMAVHAASNAQEFWNGPIYIVSGRGVKYSVQDLYTAQVLGIANGDGSAHYGLAPAPEAILRLLPTSTQTLNTQNVQHTYDTVPMPQNAGLDPTGVSSQQGSGS